MPVILFFFLEKFSGKIEKAASGDTKDGF